MHPINSIIIHTNQNALLPLINHPLGYIKAITDNFDQLFTPPTSVREVRSTGEDDVENIPDVKKSFVSGKQQITPSHPSVTITQNINHNA